MSLVIDSSVTLAWIYLDEQAEDALRAAEMVHQSGAWVPAIWPLEVANGLVQGIKRRRIDKAKRDADIADLSRMNINVDADTNAFAWTKTLEFAERFGLTTYDACYVELAHRRALPLATLDDDMRTAGRKLGIHLF